MLGVASSGGVSRTKALEVAKSGQEPRACRDQPLIVADRVKTAVWPRVPYICVVKVSGLIFIAYISA